MPIPTPQPKQKKDEFISACMGDKKMVKEYPNLKARSAVCYKAWNDWQKKYRKYSQLIDYLMVKGSTPAIIKREIERIDNARRGK